MSGHQENTNLPDKGFGFFGAITASLSHEINNVLAIINELSGLLEDFLAAADQGRPLDPERMKNTLLRISKQVDRGKTHVKQLNTFAHSVDDPDSRFDAREAFDLMVTVCQRFATLKKIALEGTSGENPLWAQGCRFDLQHAVYRCLDLVLSVSPAGSSVKIAIEPCEDGLRITASGDLPVDAMEEVGPRIDTARRQVERLGGKLEETLVNGNPPMASITLPSRLGRLAFAD